MRTKIFSLLTAALLGAGSASAQQAMNVGYCGNDYTCNPTGTVLASISNGVLTISGTGAMAGFDVETAVPWYSQRSSITSVVIDSGVTTIGQLAFYSCTALTSVTIPNGITTIDASAFYSCTALTSITIPEGVISIGNSAFRSSGLTSVTIPSSVSTMGTYVFHSCAALASVTLPDGLTSIGYHTFNRCTSLTSITLPNSLTSISQWLFPSAGLTSIVIPDGVTNIGTEAFSSCTSLTSVTLGSGLINIDNNVFFGCSKLTSVTIPNSVTNISTSAFAACTGLTSVTLGNGVASIGANAFQSCTKLATVTMLGPVPLTTSSTAFQGVPLSACTLYVPHGMKSSYQSAGAPWSSFAPILEEQDNNTRIVTFSSRGGTPVAAQIVAKNGKVTEPAAPTHYGYTFAGWCTSALVNSPYNFNTGVTDHMTLYAKWEGGSCTNNFTDYGVASAVGWSLCNGVLTISGAGEVPPGICGSSSITSVVFDSRITSIAVSAFANCAMLTSVSIPMSISLGNWAFQGCNSLTSVAIGSRTINYGAFQNCINLASVTLGNEVTTFGSYAFAGCTELHSIVLPGGVTSIGASAFQSCPLDTITSLSLTPPATDTTAFTNVPKACCLKVPAVAESAYRSAPGWSSFTCYDPLPGNFYTVSFDARGGTVKSPQTVKEGSTVAQPTKPSNSGYAFVGWCRDTAGNQPWNFATPVTGDLTLYAKWEPAFTVTFNAQGGSPTPAAQALLLQGAKVQPPAINPTRAGYVFDGWYMEPYCITPWDFTTRTVQQALTLYAKWIALYTVNFDAMSGTPSLTTQTVQHGQTVPQPPAPTYTGYTFGGWYTGTSYTTAWSFASNTVTANTTLYAKWISNSDTTYTVTFNSNNGSAIPSQLVVSGATAAQPGAPVRPGLTFAGWYTDTTYTTRWGFSSTPVAENVTLYARWLCTVTFNSNGGSGVARQLVPIGSTITKPADPRHSSYNFEAWHPDLCVCKPWDFDTDVVEGDMMMYAGWKAK